MQTRLCQLAFDVFTSRPKEGESIGGVLLGKSGRDGVEVTDFWQGAENKADVVGHWSVRRRVSQELEGDGVLIVIAPVTVQRAEALVWQRGDGGAETEPRRMTFQVERRVSKREDRRPEVKPAADLRGWNLGAGCLVLAALAIWMMRAESNQPGIGAVLEMRAEADGLRVRWKENGKGRLESAALLVRQGREEATVDLTDEYKPDGAVTVRMKAPEVVVSLRVRRQGEPAIMRTVTYLDPVRVRGQSEASEVDWLRWRNRELEATLAAMQARF